MKTTIKLLMLLFCLCSLKTVHGDTQCGGGAVGSGGAAQNKVLFVWAKTIDDPSAFPSWANTPPTTLTDFYQVMSYNQHTVTTKIATKNGGFFVSDPGHTVSYYKSLWQSGQGYLGPYGIFVAEILAKVEAQYGANYFDDVNVISMMITDGGQGWYFPEFPLVNASGVGYLGVTYTTGNGRTFDAQYGGINTEFAEGEEPVEWIVCHEYGHFLGLEDLMPNLGTYSLMQNSKVNDSNEGVTPLSVKDVTDLGWLDLNDPTRVQTVTANTSVTLQPLRSPTGIVAAKVLHDANNPYSYFLIANHQRSTNVYDGTYPADGLLIWHIEGISYTDIECAVGTDPIANGFNKDHLNLFKTDPNYHGEGLASDFFNPSGQSQFTPWTNPNTDGTGSQSPPTNLAITNISSNGNTMSFDVIYNFSSGTITVDSWWKNSLLITDDVTLNSGKTLTLMPNVFSYIYDNSTLTLNPNAMLYVDGTLEIHRNATITGGGSIVKSGNGKIFVTNSASALAANNSRKLARGVNGNYHLVFETAGEICYERLTNTGAITQFHRLSNGVAGEVKSNPSIAIRDNNILVVWQKNTGSSHDITFHKSTDYGATWSTSNRKTLATNVGANPPLPVVVNPATNELLVVYRTASNLSYRTSSDNGNTWDAAAAVPSSGAYGNSPALAVTSTYWSTPRTAMANATEGGIGTIFYRYYKSGDSSGWASPLLKNLSQIVPGSYTGHQKPSLAPSGIAGNTTLHVAWEVMTTGGQYRLIHRKATDWVTWPSVYSVISSAYDQLREPNITGLSGSYATLVYQDLINPTENDIYKISYDGGWGEALFVSSGTNPSVSLGNTTAKYV